MAKVRACCHPYCYNCTVPDMDSHESSSTKYSFLQTVCTPPPLPPVHVHLLKLDILLLCNLLSRRVSLVGLVGVDIYVYILAGNMQCV